MALLRLVAVVPLQFSRAAAARFARLRVASARASRPLRIEIFCSSPHRIENRSKGEQSRRLEDQGAPQ